MRALPLLLLAACELPESGDGPAVLATEVVEAPGHTGEGFFDADLAVNGVHGEGQHAGSLDVYSLGLDADDVLVLGWHGDVVLDVDGPDLAVFENPFDVIGGGRFMDPVVVEVSPDGVDWVAFPFAYGAGSEYSDDPSDWDGFAGLTPVLLHEEDNPVDPLSEAAGGDRFDLADLGSDDPIAARIADEGARYLRLSSAPAWTDPQTGAPHPAAVGANGADIDGVYAAAVAPR